MARHKPKPTKPDEEPDLPTTADGAKLDSWLSDRIMETVNRQMQQFYIDRSWVIAEGLFSALSRDPYLRIAFTKKFADAVLASGHPVTKKIYKGIRHVLEHSIAHGAHVGDVAAHGFVHTFGQGAWHSVATGLGASLLHALGPVIAKLVATHVTAAWFMHAMAAAWKHVIVHSVLGGMAAAAAPFFFHMSLHAFLAVATPLIVIPIALAQIFMFPGKLAKEVAPNVRAAVGEVLKGNGEYCFRNQNRSALGLFAEQAFEKGCSKLVKKMVEDQVEGIPFVEKVLKTTKQWCKEQTEVQLVREFPEHEIPKAWDA